MRLQGLTGHTSRAASWQALDVAASFLLPIKSSAMISTLLPLLFCLTRPPAGHGRWRVFSAGIHHQTHRQRRQKRVQAIQSSNRPKPPTARRVGREKGYGYMPPKAPQTMVETILLWPVRPAPTLVNHESSGDQQHCRSLLSTEPQQQRRRHASVFTPESPAPARHRVTV